MLPSHQNIDWGICCCRAVWLDDRSARGTKDQAQPQEQVNLISTCGKDLVDLGELGLGGGGSLGLEGITGLLLLVVGIGLGLALVLELLEEVLVLPSDLVGEITEDGVVADGVEADDAEGGGDHLTLDSVVRVGDSLESRKTGEGVLAAGRLLMALRGDERGGKKEGCVISMCV